jgi:transmembrane sensor
LKNRSMTPADDANSKSEVLAQGKAWLMHLRSGKATPEDAQAYKRWCDEHPEMAATLRETWSTLRAVADDIAREDAMSGEAWTGNTGWKRAFHPKRRAFVGFAVAAGASWLALRPPLQLWPAVSDFAADYRTGTGEQRQVALSDRVTVEMNTQTRINVPAPKVNEHGIDLLAGEAEIVAVTPLPGRIAPIQSVVVAAGRARMQADIARFNVRRTGEHVCVTCVSGSIAFDHPQGQLTILADQQVVYDDRNVRRVAGVDLSAATAWRRGKLVFNDVPVADVVDEINRYRPGKVILRNAQLGRNQLQAQFPIARLDEVIDMFAKLYGAHITRLPGNIVLLS